jgi:hypothetical protein
MKPIPTYTPDIPQAVIFGLLCVGGWFLGMTIRAIYDIWRDWRGRK